MKKAKPIAADGAQSKNKDNKNKKETEKKKKTKLEHRQLASRLRHAAARRPVCVRVGVLSRREIAKISELENLLPASTSPR